MEGQDGGWLFLISVINLCTDSGAGVVQAMHQITCWWWYSENPRTGGRIRAVVKSFVYIVYIV